MRAARPSLVLAAAALACAPAAARAQEPGAIRTVLSTIEPGEQPATRGATRAAAPVTVYINTEGGIFTPGEPNDSTENVTSVPDLTVQLYPWIASDSERAELLSCVKEMFAPFNLVVTGEDPGDEPHLEAVIGNEPLDLGLDPTVAGVSPFLTNCGVIENSIVFVFPGVVGSDVRRVCETVAQEVAHSFGLDHEYLCQDPMTYLTGCGEKSFLFEESVCGEFVPRDCACSRSQNSAQMLLDRLGRGDKPTVWLSQPSTGDLLAAGFPVQAVFTHAPASLRLYVDGVLADEVSPDEIDDPYQIVEFETDDALRSGTHHIELRARFGDEDRKVSALVDVEGEPGEEVVGQGCSAGRGGAGPGGAILVGLLLAGASLRRRRLAAIGLVAAAAGLTGCWTTVFGSPADDIESGCPGAGEVSPAVGVLWSPQGGTCTATLVGPNGFVTAAHCVAEAADGGDPIVVVLDGRQYIAAYTYVYPDWQPGSAIDDVAALLVTEPVADVAPLSLEAEEPAAGGEFKIVGHGEWQPDDQRDPERQALVASIAALDERSFTYDEQADDDCLAGRGGGPVLAGGDEDRVIGLHGEDQSAMRLDRYACWLACGAGPEILPGQLAGCDCTRADQRPCGDCGVELLDFASGTWSVCHGAEDGTCEDGLTCDASGRCVPPPE